MQLLPASLSGALRVAGAVAVAALLLAPGNRAEAACGDYLLHGAGAAGHLSGGSPSGLPVPCHGPQCSANHSLPATPVAPPQVLSQQDWLLSFGLAADLDGSRWRPLAGPADSAFEQPILGGIFRPPCSA